MRFILEPCCPSKRHSARPAQFLGLDQLSSSQALTLEPVLADGGSAPNPTFPGLGRSDSADGARDGEFIGKDPATRLEQPGAK
jgi:hypothetical protein